VNPQRQGFGVVKGGGISLTHGETEAVRLFIASIRRDRERAGYRVWEMLLDEAGRRFAVEPGNRIPEAGYDWAERKTRAMGFEMSWLDRMRARFAEEERSGECHG